jgi:anti-sigma B factor antagonist
VKIDIEKKGKAAVIHVQGRMDAMTAIDFSQACEQLLDEGQAVLIVDLGALEYISSAGLRSMLVIGKKVKEDDGRLMLCHLQGEARSVFEISGFSSLFPLYDSVEAALEDIK